MYKTIFPLLAVLGAVFGLLIVYVTQRPTRVPPIPFPPAVSPYGHSLAGVGIIEASSQNLAVGSPFQEVVTQIFVIEGDQVKAGDPLFQLDLRNFEAQRIAAQANVDKSLVALENATKQFSFYQRLQDPRAITELAFEQARYAKLQAEADVNIAKGNLQVIEANIERSTIRAPIDGQVLQLNIHVGEVTPPVVPVVSNQSEWLVASNGALLLLGATQPLQMRVDIDEEDCWRFESGANATAFVRGNSYMHFPMTFFRTEPYIIPKSSFTGETAERVDTRVLQILYRFEKGDLPIYVGQVLDVFIEAKPVDSFVKK